MLALDYGHVFSDGHSRDFAGAKKRWAKLRAKKS